MELAGKRIIVTGGGRGIGRTLVGNLHAAGAVVGVLDLDADRLAQLEEDCPGTRGLVCDVTDDKQIRSAVESFCGEVGGVDALVNNAGILFSAPLVSLTPQGVVTHDRELWDKVITTDLSSVFYVTAHVVRHMVAKRIKGVIVNISSISAGGNAGQSAYSAAKAGVNALTATWAKELSLMGIRVVGVAPGFVDTESTHQALSENVLQSTVKRVPLRRLGRAEEIVGGIVFALQNDFLNGKIIEVDGGLTL
jgi:3-oxoacyl-[acyl-carrier protein] reductase